MLSPIHAKNSGLISALINQVSIFLYPKLFASIAPICFLIHEPRICLQKRRANKPLPNLHSDDLK